MRTDLKSGQSGIRATERYGNPDADRFYRQVWAGEDVHIGIGRYQTEKMLSTMPAAKR